MKIRLSTLIKGSLYFLCFYVLTDYAICVFYNKKAEAYLSDLNIYFHYVGGPPKNWQPPWKWNMIEYISVGAPRQNDFDVPIDQEAVSKVIYFSTKLCCLQTLQIIHPVLIKDLKNLKKLKSVGYLQISTTEKNFPKQELANTLSNTFVIIDGKPVDNNHSPH